MKFFVPKDTPLTDLLSALVTMDIITNYQLFEDGLDIEVPHKPVQMTDWARICEKYGFTMHGRAFIPIPAKPSPLSHLNKNVAQAIAAFDQLQLNTEQWQELIIAEQHGKNRATLINYLQGRLADL